MSLCALLVVCWVFGGLSLAAGAAAKTTTVHGVWMAGPGCGSRHEWFRHPRGFPYFCDGNADLERAHWKNWGAPKATAHAILNEAAVNSHNSVATAPRRRTAVTIVASQIKLCGTHHAYTRIIIKLHKAVKGIKKLREPEFLPRCSTSPPKEASGKKRAEFRAEPSGLICGMWDGQLGVVSGVKCHSALAPSLSDVGEIHVAEIGPSGNVRRCTEPADSPEDFCEWGNVGRDPPKHSAGEGVQIGRFFCEVLEEGVECTAAAAGKGFLMTPKSTRSVH
jgi:hypothetical protein